MTVLSEYEQARQVRRHLFQQSLRAGGIVSDDRFYMFCRGE